MNRCDLVRPTVPHCFGQMPLNERCRRVSVPLAFSLAMFVGGPRARCGEEASFYCLLVPFDEVGPSAVVAFDVTASGTLVQRSSYPTGGRGMAMSSVQDLQ